MLGHRSVSLPASQRSRRRVATFALLGAFAACSRDGAAPSDGEVEAHVRAPAQVAAVLARIGEAVPGGLGPIEEGRPVVDVELAASASAAARVTDRASGLALTFALDGAADARAAEDTRVAVYAEAGPEGADLVQRETPFGIEDFVYFAEPPARSELVYRVGVEEVAGLRLLGGTLELLDSGGAPRLRVRRPFAVDARGVRVDADLAVEGCAYDTSPELPWGRAVTPPGASSCVVRISWRAEHYPLLVDPQWVSTQNNMTFARTRMAVTEIAPGSPTSRLLVTGGFGTTGTALASAEVYEPLSRTFALVDAMQVARGNHAAASLADPVAPGGVAAPVVVSGGATIESTPTPIASIEVFNPATGRFKLDPNPLNALNPARFQHTATLFAAHKVLIAGGTGDPLNQPTNSAFVYDFSNFDGSGDPVASLVATANTLNSSRTAHAATRLASGNVLVTGGFVLSGTALTSAELWDATGGTFGSVSTSGGGLAQMSALRALHTATLITEGPAATKNAVVIVGGVTGKTGGVYNNTIDIFRESGSQTGFEPQGTPITMADARASHTAALLAFPDPDASPPDASYSRLVVVGGTSGSGALAKAESYDPVGAAFSALPAPSGRRDHGSATVVAGQQASGGRGVLVLGGRNASDIVLSTAQLLLEPNGDACTLDQECLSGFCTDGVCCDTRCLDDCYHCTAALKQSGADDGTCGPTVAVPNPAVPDPLTEDVQCVDEVQTYTRCNGAGARVVVKSDDCKPSTCSGDGVNCSSFCDSNTVGVGQRCSPTGWCDINGEACLLLGQGGAGGGPAANSCRPRKDLGQCCGQDYECKPGSQCVDGVCCNSPCGSQCAACDVEGSVGTCRPVPAGQTPRLGGAANRVECAGQGTTCGGECNGSDQDSCAYPGADVVDEASFACVCPNDDCEIGPATETHDVCNGVGEAQEVTNDACLGFRCASDLKCRTSCATDEDCILDYICEASACIALTGPKCDADHTLRLPAAPDRDCTPYMCRGEACLETCSSVNDCVAPAVCNAAGHCVDQLPVAEVPSCSCRLVARGGPREGGTGAWLWATLAGLAAVGRRRRR